MTSLETTKIFFTEVFIIFLSIILIVLAYPLLFVFLLPCWMYKKIITYFLQKNPKYGNCLDGISGASVGQAPYLKPDIVLIPYYTVADKLDVPKVVEVIKEKIIKPGLYPELTQKIVQKYGYHFWYFINNFKVEDHVRHLKPNCPNMPVTRQELRELVAGKLGRLPFNPEKSPWEILIVTNYICDRDPEVKSVFIMRVNHCLMDGYALANFASTCATKPWIDKLGGGFQNRKPNVNVFQSLYMNTLLFLTVPYHLLKLFVFYNDKHAYVKNVYKCNFEDKWNTQCTPAVSSDRLKAVKNAYSVGMSSLITTMFAQAFYKTMKQNRLTEESNYLHGFISFPLPGHPGTMTNHWSLIRMQVKVNLQDVSETLKFVENEYQSLRNSVRPLVFPVFVKLITIVPLCFRSSSKPVPPTSFVLTNFPGPAVPCDIFGCRAKQISLGGNCSDGAVAVFGCFSLSGNFLFDSGSPVCNLPTQEHADYLSNEVLKTLEDLEKLKGIKQKSV